MKKTISMFTAMLLLCAIFALPVHAAEEIKSSHYYPISVDEYIGGDFDEPRIQKVYQLSLDDDPAKIPTEDFVRNGRLYYLLDMTRQDEIGVDTKSHIQTVTLPSKTNDMERILQTLDAEIEAATEDGYATKTGTVSASRTYSNLSDADLSLVPKTISDNGRNLTLADVQWSNSTDGETTRYTATARYTGTTSSKYATGYTVTADYSGEVSKTGCDVVVYTAIFGSVEAPKEENVERTPTDLSGLKRSAIVGVGILAFALSGTFVITKIRKRR